MEVMQAGSRIYGIADKHGRNVETMLSRPDFGENSSDLLVLNHEISRMGAMWQFAAGMVKEMTEPLKSIVNK